MPDRPLFRVAPLVTAVAVMTVSGRAAADEPSPYYIGLTGAVTHDSNVYRTSGEAISDTFYSLGVIGGFDQSVGRQHFYGTGNIRYNRYDRQTTLSNPSYGLNTGWDWSTIERLSGSVNVSAGQSLATFNGNQAVVNGTQLQQTGDRELVRTAQLATSIRYGGYGRFSLGGDYAHSIVRYSGAPNVESGNSSADSLGGGIYYNVNPDATVGVGYRLTRTVQPGALFVPPDQYDDLTSRGRNIDLTASYHYSAQTNFSGRLSFTRQSNSGSSGQDFSGLTGSINANYMPTGKIGLNLSYARDAGTNGNFFNVPATQGTTLPTTGLYQNSQTTDSLSGGISYAASAKISATAGYTYRRARIVGTTTAAGTTIGSGYTDKLGVASLGVSYAALRWATVGCNYGHENRTISGLSGYSYVDNTIGCSFTATLR